MLVNAPTAFNSLTRRKRDFTESTRRSSRLQPLSSSRSRLAAERDEIIEVDQIHPRLNILARFGKRADPPEEDNQGLLVAIRRAADHVLTPLPDFPWRWLMLGIALQPFQNLTVAFSCAQLLKHYLGVKAKKVDYVLIEWRVILKLAVLADDRGATFIEHARQGDKAAQLATRTSRRTLGQIGCGDLRGVRHVIFR